MSHQPAADAKAVASVASVTVLAELAVKKSLSASSEAHLFSAPKSFMLA